MAVSARGSETGSATRSPGMVFSSKVATLNELDGDDFLLSNANMYELFLKQGWKAGKGEDTVTMVLLVFGEMHHSLVAGNAGVTSARMVFVVDKYVFPMVITMLLIHALWCYSLLLLNTALGKCRGAPPVCRKRSLTSTTWTA